MLKEKVCMFQPVAYLLGLMCGRGHILKTDKRIVIEFAHKNETISGIALCPKCGDLATASKDGDAGVLVCKSCKNQVPESVKQVYEQKKSTIKSIHDNIIPYLSTKFNSSFEVVGNDHMTYLVMEFKENDETFTEIANYFQGKTGFDSFIIPKELYGSTKENKIEFVNGFLDTAGFFNSGGWLPRNGKNGTGRMRAYIQIVRNWKMPVLICNFLKNELGLPIHTIDWGHPNIRDSDMNDYFNSGKTTWSREHQVKFFPEYYTCFALRITHKQKMFEELSQYNKRVSFDNLEDCDPPSPISRKQLKPTHLGENDFRIPQKLRNHYDAYWQLCSTVGCIFANKKISASAHPDAYFLTGMLDAGQKAVEEFNEIRCKLTAEKIAAHKKLGPKVKKESKQRENPEEALYEPIGTWFQSYLKASFEGEIIVHNTSSQYLDKFVAGRRELYDLFDSCEEYKIKPDLVGFITERKELGFVEVKVGELTLKDIGQLLGYCLVAKPTVAILTSPKNPSITLIKTLKAYPQLLQYSEDRKLLIGTWNDGKIEIGSF
jgi:DNA-directed RNA polymerase subunit M/transcription elongation factor TFIIS